MTDFFSQMWTVLSNLHHAYFNPEKLIEVLKDPTVMVAAFVVIALVIFTETGLLIGFFLPGDSLLVATGVAAAAANWPLVPLLLLLSVAAIVGDTLGYWIGYRTGPRMFQREKSWLFHPEHLRRAQAFYERHGGKTIIIARFMPLIRTFAPIVAGIGQMEYRRFVMYNIIGGIGWVVSMVLTGYFLVAFIDRFAGENFTVKNLEKIIVVVVLLSIAPGIWAVARSWFGKRKAVETPTEKV